jgi:hypothetical protein
MINDLNTVNYCTIDKKRKGKGEEGREATQMRSRRPEDRLARAS